MKYKQVGKNTYRKVSVFKENEDVVYTVLSAIVFTCILILGIYIWG